MHARPNRSRAPSHAHRHVFCDECVSSWLPLKPECPECRQPVERSSLTPDRLADRLVSNLQGFCTLRKGGCTWVGKRGELPAHLARECPCAPVYCPNEGCGAEVRRCDLASHLATCAATTEAVECPFGCGARVGPGVLEGHKAECLLEPKKLMAAISRLALDNETLTLENARLREACMSMDEGGSRSGSASPELAAGSRGGSRRKKGPGVCVE